MEDMTMLRFRYDFDATLQASAIVIRCHGGSMAYIRLLKLLYIADRELLAESGMPLTGDRAVAMDHGPVLSKTFDIIKQSDAESDRWAKAIQRVGYSVRLIADPGHKRLSKGQVAKLTQLCDRYMGVDDFELADDVTHKFQEWRDNYVAGTSRPIPWDNALAAQDRPELAAVVAADIAASNAFDDLIASVQ